MSEAPPSIAATDYARARDNMVNSQLACARVDDPRILAAMRMLPRELFVPPARADTAYVDIAIPLGGGRTMLEPRVIARLVQAAHPRAGERALVIGAGYGAALLAALGLDVAVVEEDEALLERARTACLAVGLRVHFAHAPLTGGAPDEAPFAPPFFPPFAIVLIDGGVAFVPDAIAAAVTPLTGRLITVLRAPGEPGRAVIAEHADTALRLRPIFDAAAGLLPGFEKADVFRF